ncbi:TDT family transporter [Rhodococcus aerolatus]
MRRLLTSLEPRWFTAVMGTAVIAVAGAKLGLPGVRVVSWVALVVAAALLVALLLGSAGHWLAAPRTATEEVRRPSSRSLAGAPPIALLAVSGALSALALSWQGVSVVLWVLGTAIGVVTALLVPVTVLGQGEVSPTVLLAAAPPVVSVSTGIPLLGVLPAGQARVVAVVLAYGAAGGVLLLTAGLTLLVVGRVTREGGIHGQGEPGVWVVLGALAQGVAAITLTDAQAPEVLGPRLGPAVQGAGTLLAFVLWGTALAVLAVVVGLTVAELRAGLGFGLSWWSVTFPFGSLVTATTGVSQAVDASSLRLLAEAQWVVLVVLVLAVGAATVRAVVRGDLLPREPAPA